MALEPPPGYVEFVARHLTPLRRDAAEVAGDDDADGLYQDVLTDVAARWGWLQLRGALSRSSAADAYLSRAFARRSERWQAEQLETRSASDIHVWQADFRRPPRPVQSSAAVRLAPYLRPGARARVGPVGEAAVAWWHAYEAHRRRRILAGCLLALLVVALIARTQQELDAASAAPAPAATITTITGRR
jgi:hypothetical protein